MIGQPPRRSGATAALRSLCALLLAAGLLTPAVTRASQPPAQPADEAFQPILKPTLQVTRAVAAIVVDGDLADPGWVGAARATGFSENWPDEMGRPSVESEVWVTYDDRHLYLALIAYDEPSGIRASLRDRDEIWSDDYFGILLDTYGDATWAYFLFANPLGVQGDTRYDVSGGEDDGFDIIYYSEGKITDDGYRIEMAIPFASLRFPDRDVQTWRATFWRTRPRGSREQHTWAAMSRDSPCFLCQFGTLTGMQGVKPGGALELLPSLVLSEAGSLRDADDPDSGFDNGSLDAEPSLSARYAFSSGLTAEAALNPDFSQVESDAGLIDVNTTFALFFPERRPFFQEGSDLFSSYFTAVYTRQINDPQFATKLVGRHGATSVAYLLARDEHSPLLLPFEERSFLGLAGKSLSNVVRARRGVGDNSYLGAIFTDRRLEGNDGAGTVGGVDGRLGFLKNYQFEFQALGSHTQEPNDTSLTSGVNGLTFDRGKYTAAFDGESFSGYATYTSLERSARFWNFDFDYWASSPTFRADNGFETQNDFRRVSMWQGLNVYPKTSLIDEIGGGVFLQRTWNFDDVRKREVAEPSIWMGLTGQTFVNFWYTLGSERFRGIEFGDTKRWGFFGRTAFSEPLRLEVFVSHGRRIARFQDPPIMGEGTDVETFWTITPTARLVIQPSLRFSQLRELNGGPTLFRGYILRTRTSVQFNRELFVRIIVQFNDFSETLSIEPLLTYKLNPFTLFYIGSTLGYDDYDTPDRLAPTSRQFFAKFQYLFRR
ncbi:MAG: DUF5916 domain-containing protein [Gemmatimonadota bacterium]